MAEKELRTMTGKRRALHTPPAPRGDQKATLEEYDREIRRRLRRRLRRRMFSAAGEVAGGILTLALFVLLAWLFLAATPDQFSAECEALRAEMEARGE